MRMIKLNCNLTGVRKITDVLGIGNHRAVVGS